jgi:hypothetical protein
MDRRDDTDDQRGRGSGPRASALTDPLTSVDDLLRETNDKLGQLVTELSRERPPLQRGDPGPEVGGGGARLDPSDPPVYPHDFSQVVEPNTLRGDPDSAEFIAPHDGTVRRIILGWPLGTQQAVGIGVRGADRDALIPRGPKDARFIAYDDEVLSFELNESVNKDDSLTFEFVNNDTEGHFVNVDVFFQRGVGDAD